VDEELVGYKLGGHISPCDGSLGSDCQIIS
jgi:hypothetical protein